MSDLTKPEHVPSCVSTGEGVTVPTPAPTPRTKITKLSVENIIAHNRRPFAVHQLWAMLDKLQRELMSAQAALAAAQATAREAMAEAGKDRERLETVIRWALGEVEDFPTWPDSVTIKGNPKFWWRTELRKRFDTARAGEGRP